MNKNLVITTFLGMFAIILGAFGAHALKNNLTAEALESFQTGVRYQMYHVLLLLFINTYNGFPTKFKNKVSILIFIGIICFSGSIYLIHLTSISSKSIWFITPLGGLFFILAWMLLLFKFLKKES